MERYSRQMIMPQIGHEGQVKLTQSKVLIVGAGGIGSTVAMYLAASGVPVDILDFDIVEVSNLHRQVIHDESKQGNMKAVSAVQRMSSINSSLHYRGHICKLTADNACEIIEAYDLVVDATDNADARYTLNDCCVLLRKPYVSGSAVAMDGQITTIIPYVTPCYRCLHPDPPTPASSCQSCSDAGVLGPIPGLIGCLEAIEAIKLLLNKETYMKDHSITLETGEPAVAGKRQRVRKSPTQQLQPLLGRQVLYDAIGGSFHTFTLPARNPQCRVCGDCPSIRSMQQSADSLITVPMVQRMSIPAPRPRPSMPPPIPGISTCTGSADSSPPAMTTNTTAAAAITISNKNRSLHDENNADSSSSGGDLPPSEPGAQHPHRSGTGALCDEEKEGDGDIRNGKSACTTTTTTTTTSSSSSSSSNRAIAGYNSNDGVDLLPVPVPVPVVPLLPEENQITVRAYQTLLDHVIPALRAPHLLLDVRSAAQFSITRLATPEIVTYASLEECCTALAETVEPVETVGTVERNHPTVDSSLVPSSTQQNGEEEEVVAVVMNDNDGGGIFAAEGGLSETTIQSTPPQPIIPNPSKKGDQKTHEKPRVCCPHVQVNVPLQELKGGLRAADREKNQQKIFDQINEIRWRLRMRQQQAIKLHGSSSTSSSSSSSSFHFRSLPSSPMNAPEFVRRKAAATIKREDGDGHNPTTTTTATAENNDVNDGGNYDGNALPPATGPTIQAPQPQTTPVRSLAAVYVLCRRGIASSAATQILLEEHLENQQQHQVYARNVYNIQGGLTAWSQEVEKDFVMY